jgi:O-antigen/teichoic acid export membrane protein
MVGKSSRLGRIGGALAFQGLGVASNVITVGALYRIADEESFRIISVTTAISTIAANIVEQSINVRASRDLNIGGNLIELRRRTFLEKFFVSLAVQPIYLFALIQFGVPVEESVIGAILLFAGLLAQIGAPIWQLYSVGYTISGGIAMGLIRFITPVALFFLANVSLAEYFSINLVVWCAISFVVVRIVGRVPWRITMPGLTMALASLKSGRHLGVAAIFGAVNNQLPTIVIATIFSGNGKVEYLALERLFAAFRFAYVPINRVIFPITVQLKQKSEILARRFLIKWSIAGVSSYVALGIFMTFMSSYIVEYYLGREALRYANLIPIFSCILPLTFLRAVFGTIGFPLFNADKELANANRSIALCVAPATIALSMWATRIELFTAGLIFFELLMLLRILFGYQNMRRAV